MKEKIRIKEKVPVALSVEQFEKILELKVSNGESLANTVKLLNWGYPMRFIVDENYNIIVGAVGHHTLYEKNGIDGLHPYSKACFL